MSVKSLRLQVAAATLGLCTQLAMAADEAVITEVHEDWVMVLNVPDDSAACPQFHTIMSSTGDLEGRYFQVNWNYREYPGYQAGGLELLNWSGESLLANKTMREAQLSTAAETVTWTQVLFTNGEVLAFIIYDGHSTTWGEFSTVSWGLTPGLENLNGYQPDVSVQNSGITYGSNRVNILKLVGVRYYDSDGNLVNTDNTTHVVFQSASE